MLGSPHGVDGVITIYPRQTFSIVKQTKGSSQHITASDSESTTRPITRVHRRTCIGPDAFPTTDGWRISRYNQEQLTSLSTTSHQETFFEYLQNLPPHESLLLKECETLGGGAQGICRIITSLREVILVTDGGAAADYGSFGWVLGLLNGTQLAQGSGVVFGHDPKSYRAEAHGAKAGSLFLMHLFRYHEHRLQPDDDGFQYYCDNEGLNKKLLVFRTHENALTSTCLHSEWDIISAIHSTHNAFQWMPSLFHVKSHQDDNGDPDMFDLPTLMNIEADALATKALADGASIPQVPFDSATGVMLSIAGRVITRKLEATLNNHEHTGPLLGCYRSRFHWSQKTLTSIDWDAFAIWLIRYMAS